MINKIYRRSTDAIRPNDSIYQCTQYACHGLSNRTDSKSGLLYDRIGFYCTNFASESGMNILDSTRNFSYSVAINCSHGFIMNHPVDSIGPMDLIDLTDQVDRMDAIDPMNQVV